MRGTDDAEAILENAACDAASSVGSEDDAHTVNERSRAGDVRGEYDADIVGEETACNAAGGVSSEDNARVILEDAAQCSAGSVSCEDDGSPVEEEPRADMRGADDAEVVRENAAGEASGGVS